MLPQKRDDFPRVENYFENTIPVYELADFRGQFISRKRENRFPWKTQ